jgi:hypothetical protein
VAKPYFPAVRNLFQSESMATLNEYTVLDPSIEPAWGTNKCHMRPIPLLDKNGSRSFDIRITSAMTKYENHL